MLLWKEKDEFSLVQQVNNSSPNNDSPAAGKVIANLKVPAYFFALEHQFWVPSFSEVGEIKKKNRNNFYAKKNILFFYPSPSSFEINFTKLVRFSSTKLYAVLYFNQLELTEVSFKPL